jgi:putative membrane protein
MSFFDVLPHSNAVLNATSTCLLVAAFVAIKQRKIELHKRLMLSAITCSAIFLVGYVTRMLATGTHRFPDVGWVKTAYLVLLASHSLLALVALPLILRSAFLGLRRDDARHRSIAKLTWPIWLYVSVTGVAVYLMLYQLAPRLIKGQPPSSSSVAVPEWELRPPG